MFRMSSASIVFRKMVALAVLAVALFYSAAQAWAATPPPPASIVLIGFAAPLSEFSARHGRNAALLAIEEANKDNPRIAGQPVQFQLLEQDDKSDVVVTPYVARTLVASKVIGVVGHWSSATTMAAAPVYSDAGLAHISPTAWTRELTQKSFKTIFQMVGNNAAGLAFAADYLVRDQKLKRVFILDDGGYLGTAMAGYFYEDVKTAGGEVVHRASINSKTSDFNPPLQRAQQLQPDLIFFSGRTVQSGVLTSNLPRFQMQPALLLTDNVVNEDFLRNVAKTETPVMAIVPGTPVQRRPRMAALEKKYIERYDAEMTAFGAYAYDSVHLLIAAAKKSNSLDRGKIVEALREIRYAGVTGNIGFDASGALLRPDYTLYRIEQKKWVPVKVFGGK